MQPKHTQKYFGMQTMQRSTLMYVCLCTWPRPLVPLTVGGCVCAAAASSVLLYPECFCEGHEPDSAHHYIPAGTQDPSAA